MEVQKPLSMREIMHAPLQHEAIAPIHEAVVCEKWLTQFIRRPKTLTAHGSEALELSFTIVEVDDLASYETNTMNIGHLHAHKALALEQYCQSQPDHVHDPEELLVIVDTSQHICTSCLRPRNTRSMRWHCSLAGHCGRSRGTNHVGTYGDRQLVSGFEVRCSCRGTSRICQADPTNLARSLPPCLRCSLLR